MTTNRFLSSGLVKRVLLPATMATFLLLGLAYWWLDNLAHEIFGTAMFVLLGWHIAVNRIWFRNLFRGRYDFTRVLVMTLHFILAANMLLLLVTSIVISRSMFSALPIPDIIYLREIHWFSAYWVMMFAGGHVGLHWNRVLSVFTSHFDLRFDKPAVAFLLRVPTIMIAVFGIWSFTVLSVWTKLTFNYSLAFWDFTSSVTPFFGHWAGVIALPALVTHHWMIWMRRRRRLSAVI